MVNPQNESTNAGHRGGLPRSSGEVSVMEMEQRGRPVHSKTGGQPEDGRNLRMEIKPFNIPKRIVFEAFKRVKANRGGYGVDVQSLADFEQNLSPGKENESELVSPLVAPKGLIKRWTGGAV